MTVENSRVTFVTKAEKFGPRYYKDELIALRNSGAEAMVQIPGFITNDPKPATKMVIGIDSNGHLMDDPTSLVVAPCPNYCQPPGTGGLITLTNFLNL